MEDKLTPFNGLSPAEAERLAFLVGEAAEVIHISGKILQHGYESTNPDGDPSVTNRMLLLKEIADISAVMTQLLKYGDLPNPPTDQMIYSKLERLRKYSHHQE